MALRRCCNRLNWALSRSSKIPEIPEIAPTVCDVRSKRQLREPFPVFPAEPVDCLMQYLAGHSSPTTTRVYDRRRRKVTQNIVERISI